MARPQVIKTIFWIIEITSSGASAEFWKSTGSPSDLVLGPDREFLPRPRLPHNRRHLPRCRSTYGMEICAGVPRDCPGLRSPALRLLRPLSILQMAARPLKSPDRIEQHVISGPLSQLMIQISVGSQSGPSDLWKPLIARCFHSLRPYRDARVKLPDRPLQNVLSPRWRVAQRWISRLPLPLRTVSARRRADPHLRSIAHYPLRQAGIRQPA